MQPLEVARIDGQWVTWSEQLEEWLPLPLAPEATENDVRHFYAGRDRQITIVTAGGHQ
ncbi:hypothetical protein [Streptomyces sp. NPDC127098]|uniref:hypothetical protein n=1 Tax=Streptomyces sp. NPDC127098 TaxID=3347137 RepID=UPI003651DCF2